MNLKQKQKQNPYISSIQESSDSSNLLISNASDIQILDYATLSRQLSIPVPDATEIKFNQNLIWYSNNNKVSIYDIRTANVVNSWDCKSKVLTFSINSSNEIIGAGCELNGDEARMPFFDIRSNMPIMEFVECHSDDITQLAFHPTLPNIMVSGSTDGLICLYNLTNTIEEDALYQVIKDNSINKLGFFGPRNEYIYSMTHIETFSLYKFEDSECIKSFGDIRNQVSGMEVNYLIDCIYDAERLYFVCGSYSGAVGMVHVGLDELEPVEILTNGHEETVRAVHWSKKNNELLTGCESGMLIKWG